MIPWPHQSRVPCRWQSHYRRLQSWRIGLLFVFFIFGVLSSSTQARENEPDICKDIPGEMVAKAVSGQLKEAKAYEGKCVYFISSKDAPSKMEAFVIYRHPVDDFSGLKEAEEGKGEVVKGVGDEASLTFDKDTKRYWLLVTKNRLVTLQVSGGDRDAVRKIAAAVIHAYTTR